LLGVWAARPDGGCLSQWAPASTTGQQFSLGSSALFNGISLNIQLFRLQYADSDNIHKGGGELVTELGEQSVESIDVQPIGMRLDEMEIVCDQYY
jgi:hypothetical protein